MQPDEKSKIYRIFIDKFEIHLKMLTKKEHYYDCNSELSFILNLKLIEIAAQLILLQKSKLMTYNNFN